MQHLKNKQFSLLIMPVLRILLAPFAFIYKLITDLRNHLYDIGNRKSITFDRFVISVGNLTVGGTGKTPFVELLVRLLKDKLQIAVVSRGYGRNTRGFKLATAMDNANTIGDEPYQYFMKHGKEVAVAVGEDRALAIPELLFQKESIRLIILDDAYQHRSVNPQLNILLSDFFRPFYKDYVMPAGWLRESRKHARRADLIVVTKCPQGLSDAEKQNIEADIRKYARGNTQIYFSCIRYLEPVNAERKVGFSHDILLVTGIANPNPLEKFIAQNYNLLDHIRFADHHAFTKKDISKIIGVFESINSKDKSILTTEKDFGRFMSSEEGAGFLQNYPVFYLPIELYFLGNGDSFASELEKRVKEGIENQEPN